MRQLIAIVLCGLMALPAHAGGRRVFVSSSCASNVCAAPLVTHHVASHHVNAVAVAAVPIVQTIPLAVDIQAYQYTINPTVFAQQVGYSQAQSTQSQDAIVEQVAARVVEKLKVQPEQTQSSAPASSQSQASSISGETGGLLPFSRLPEPIQAAKYRGVEVLKTNCAQCHTGATAKKGFVMFNDDGQFVSALDYSKVHQRVSTDDPKLVMPPSGKLSAEQLRSIYDVAVPNGVVNPFGG